MDVSKPATMYFLNKMENMAHEVEYIPARNIDGAANVFLLHDLNR